ncbi:hypothetical protein [Enterococcus saccharolyticus]|uniref:hypothetical protein n=1 Tax=Enterococcus saccharolyticus TaxID=41997 RepID=UPI0039DFEDBE
MKKPIYKRRWFIVLAVFTCMGIVGGFIEDDTETAKTVETTVESITTDSSETNLYDLTTNLNDFPAFLEDFETKYNSELEKSKAYDSMVRDKQVSWTATVVEVSRTKLILIESSKYREGLTWEDIQNEGLQYYSFIAKFDNDIQESDYVVGEEKTITGEPSVRGMNTDDRKMWWKLYKSETK